MTSQARALVRADASRAIGTGHVVRSLTLADNLAELGWHVTIASVDLPSPLEADVRRRGHGVLRLEPGTDYGAAEAQHIGERIGAAVDVAIADHYRVGPAWHDAARHWARSIVAIDDLADRPLSVDLVLNQNLGETPDEYRDLVPLGTRLLIGPAYALVRPQFALARQAARIPRTNVARLFVFISGADEPNVTETAARAAERIGIETDVVIGAAYPHERALHRSVRNSSRVTIHRNATDMARLMSAADLAIGAPSSASWERCCVGLPTVLVTVADNQIRAADALRRAAAGVSLGWHTEVDEQNMVDAVERLVRDPASLRKMSSAAAAITDGGGAARVSGELETLKGAVPRG